MLNWFKRWWPLRWKSTLSKVVEDYQRRLWEKDEEITKLENAIKLQVAEKHRFQRRAAKIVERCQNGERVKIVPDGVDPILFVKETGVGTVSRENTSLRTLTARISLGLRKGMPPEFVAQYLGDQIRDAVLLEYQEQSILHLERFPVG